MSSKRPWTAADTRTLRRLAESGLSMREIAERMGRNRRHIADRASRDGIDVERVIAARMRWTPQAVAKLRKLFPKFSAAEIAELLGCGTSAVYNQARTLGLRKAKGWISSRTVRLWREGRYENSRAAQYKPGHVPANKGLRRPGYAPGRMAQTQFRKGALAGAARRRYKAVGSLRVTVDGYLERKITDDPRLPPQRRWKAVARIVWEAVNGPIPRTHVVRFKPGLHTVTESEITVDRLECISRHENMRRNSYHNYPKEIATLIQLRGALNRKINNRTRKNEEPTT